MNAYKVRYLNDNEAEVTQLPYGRQMLLSSDENVEPLVRFFTGETNAGEFMDRNIEDTQEIELVETADITQVIEVDSCKCKGHK